MSEDSKIEREKPSKIPEMGSRDRSIYDQGRLDRMAEMNDQVDERLTRSMDVEDTKQAAMTNALIAATAALKSTAEVCQAITTAVNHAIEAYEMFKPALILSSKEVAAKLERDELRRRTAK